MRETFDIKIAIREELKAGLIFGLKARLPIALIIAYCGYAQEMIQLL